MNSIPFIVVGYALAILVICRVFAGVKAEDEMAEAFKREEIPNQ